MWWQPGSKLKNKFFQNRKTHEGTYRLSRETGWQQRCYTCIIFIIFSRKLAGHKSSLAETPSPPFSVICAMSANLASFGRRKFVSTRASAEILQEVKRSGLPKATPKDSIKRAREKDLADIANECGHFGYLSWVWAWRPKGKTHWHSAASLRESTGFSPAQWVMLSRMLDTFQSISMEPVNRHRIHWGNLDSKGWSFYFVFCKTICEYMYIIEIYNH